MKTIVLAGGGSGGHLTPLIAIADALKSMDSSVIVVHIGQKNELLDDVTDTMSINSTYGITAGKFRRYHGESLISHILDIKTLFFNVRDFFRFVYGTFEAWRLLGKIKPDSILLKGGFVCVPVGIAARFRRIPYITHDSDAVPGLANRLTAKHAIYNTTALPAELYPYDLEKTMQVGIPIRKEFVQVDKKMMIDAKKSLKINPKSPVLFSVGGGLGAQRVNEALVNTSATLLSHEKNLVIIHLTGKKLFAETRKQYENRLTEAQMDRIMLIDFTTELYEFSAAADIVLTRAGATNIAEFAVQAKACIVVPNPVLTGGQQLHNAKVLADAKAAIIVREENLGTLGSVILELLVQPESKLREMGNNLHELSVSDSAEKLAILLVEIAG